MKILAIDPGSTETGYIIIDEKMKIHEFGIIPNTQIMVKISESEFDECIIEMFASYGMPVGKSSFDTVVWIGRMLNCHNSRYEKRAHLMTRQKVKMNMCHSMKAKDKNINQACKDRFEPTGGGADPYKGTMKQQGPLYGVTSHVFAALALAISFFDGAEKYEYV